MKTVLLITALATSCLVHAGGTPLKCVTAANRMRSCIAPSEVKVDSTGKLRAAILYMGVEDNLEATTMRAVVNCSGDTPVQSWVRNASGVNLSGANQTDMTEDARLLGGAMCAVKKPKLDPKLKP